ncbi:HPP family protein [Catellatospora bangladeshensis]|uniref:CBS domain-containing protein n=1 Tax=Catellatospora bangladeshensis TaxID=310355 RepID=UPI00194431AA|nr:CBS domain-containing protein [Catellatospora bangladeshensis]
MTKVAVRAAKLPVREIMSKPPCCARTSSALAEALAEMGRERLRHLVAVDDGGRCAGVISDRVIAAAWAADPMSLTARTIGSVIDRQPAIVGPDATVMDAARLMGAAGVDAVAVVDRRGVAVGIVTGADLVALLAK